MSDAVSLRFFDVVYFFFCNFEKNILPGHYQILKPSFSTEGIDISSTTVEVYDIGDIVNIIEIKNNKDESSVRGKLGDGSWITLSAGHWDSPTVKWVIYYFLSKTLVQKLTELFPKHRPKTFVLEGGGEFKITKGLHMSTL